MDYAKIDNVKLANVQTRDYPDFSDAYIESADYDGRTMTEAELEVLNEDSDFVYDKVLEQVF